ncbi:MAG: phosphatase PAP2 family protein [Lachnospiraceae bacterium]|nr:phosphatase PAP2 family protein [Lachnospiraceae bacterium]
MKQLVQKYKHAWLLLAYGLFYLIWFVLLESHVTHEYTSIHIWLDDLVPFNEWFVIPYFLWFVFIAVTIGYFFFTSRSDYYRCCAYLFSGMTVCLIIYTLWPNGQNLRPDLDSLGRDNLLIDIVRMLYGTDTSTNVCPSIHVYNSIAACVAIYHSESLRRHRFVFPASVVLAVLICLSTVFLKQHSVFDGICSIVLIVLLYPLVYGFVYQRVQARQKQKERRVNQV